MGDETETTTIEVKRGTWQRLHDRKTPGDSFDDVVQAILNATDTLEQLQAQEQEKEGSNQQEYEQEQDTTPTDSSSTERDE